MNPRLKQLVDQAVSNQPVECASCNKEQWLTTFAELIIRECADLADVAEPFKINDLILSHFGVSYEPKT